MKSDQKSAGGRPIINGREDDGRWLVIKAGVDMSWSRGSSTTPENYLTDWKLFIDVEKITVRYSNFSILKYHSFLTHSATTTLPPEFLRCLASVFAANEIRSILIDRKLEERQKIDLSTLLNKQKNERSKLGFDELDIDDNLPDVSSLDGFITYDFKSDLPKSNKGKVW